MHKMEGHENRKIWQIFFSGLTQSGKTHEDSYKDLTVCAGTKIMSLSTTSGIS